MWPTTEERVDMRFCLLRKCKSKSKRCDPLFLFVMLHARSSAETGCTREAMGRPRRQCSGEPRRFIVGMMIVMRWWPSGLQALQLIRNDRSVSEPRSARDGNRQPFQRSDKGKQLTEPRAPGCRSPQDSRPAAARRESWPGAGSTETSFPCAFPRRAKR